ncbi:MAG: 1-acyl-sn-glycerol-3-phosphate acyltransferase [Clostridia bacterium]|nr:1-acyl-sn-glycerol-3-phosphate acyltransferase [Clostridia bacterium]
MTDFYKRMYNRFARIIRRIYKVDVKGAENIPETGGVILAPNHLSNRDVYIIAASVSRQVRYVAKESLFRVPILSSLIRALGAIPIKRGAGDVGAIKATIKLLNEGEMMGIYPQGTRYIGVDPRTTEPKSGIGLIAYRTRVPIVPVCIWTKNFRIIPFRKVHIRIGEPIYYTDEDFGKGSKEDYERIAKDTFDKITGMLEI